MTGSGGMPGRCPRTRGNDRRWFAMVPQSFWRAYTRLEMKRWRVSTKVSPWVMLWWRLWARKTMATWPRSARKGGDFLWLAWPRHHATGQCPSQPDRSIKQTRSRWTWWCKELDCKALLIEIASRRWAWPSANHSQNWRLLAPANTWGWDDPLDSPLILWVGVLNWGAMLQTVHSYELVGLADVKGDRSEDQWPRHKATWGEVRTLWQEQQHDRIAKTGRDSMRSARLAGSDLNEVTTDGAWHGIKARHRAIASPLRLGPRLDTTTTTYICPSTTG